MLTRFGTQDSTGSVTRPRVDGTLAPVAAPVAVAEAASLDVDSPATPGARVPMTAITGVSADLAEKLRGAGIRSVWDIAHSHPAALAEATGVPVGQIMVEDWIGQAQRIVG